MMMMMMINTDHILSYTDIYLSIYLSIYLFIYLFVCLFIYPRQKDHITASYTVAKSGYILTYARCSIKIQPHIFDYNSRIS